jgi:hypothetical protein
MHPSRCSPVRRGTWKWWIYGQVLVLVGFAVAYLKQTNEIFFVIQLESTLVGVFQVVVFVDLPNRGFLPRRQLDGC